MTRTVHTCGLMFLSVFCSAIFASAAPPLDFEVEPINYSFSKAANDVTALQKKIETTSNVLTFEKKFGYLHSVLRELKVPVSSQMLVFSKTGLQRTLVDPTRPRALYFNDDVYVGYVQEGVLEFAVTDPKLGMVFYTLDQESDAHQIQRHDSKCIVCHSTRRTQFVPGLMVRSALVNPEGQPVLAIGSVTVNHSTPLSQRWGGWFVTGTHGKTNHLGNFQLPTSKRPKTPVKNSAGSNITNLSSLTEIKSYPSPHSDIVALMVFEHQMDAHNQMVRTSYAWQIDFHRKEHQKADAQWKQEVEQLLQKLLFVNEAILEDPVRGTSNFAEEFSKRGPFDSHCRSLRQFDLKKRMFQFPCSYTIHSKLFQSLPQPVHNHIYTRLHEILTKKSPETKRKQTFAYLSTADRKNLRQLLPEVVPELKAVWAGIGK